MQLILDLLPDINLTLLPLYAAGVAGLMSFVVAQVNAASARKLARENARRDHLLKAFTPFIDYVDTRIGRYVRVCDLGKAGQFDGAMKVLRKMDHDEHLFKHVGYMAYVEQDAELTNATGNFFEWDKKSLDTLTRLIGEHADPDKIDGMQVMIMHSLLEAGRTVRLGIEQFIFGRPLLERMGRRLAKSPEEENRRL